MDQTTQSNPNSDQCTQGIRVQAAAQYLPDRSEPDRLWFYAYRIRIENQGEERVHLLTRHWIILDANNAREEVHGEGVVGCQPVLGPGEVFEYTSACPLQTAWGTMEGSYTFLREDGSEFEVAIGRFFLAPSLGAAATTR